MTREGNYLRDANDREGRSIVRHEEGLSLVMRERVLVRKRTVTELDRVDANLRKERVEVEGAEDDIGARSPAEVA